MTTRRLFAPLVLFLAMAAAFALHGRFQAMPPAHTGAAPARPVSALAGMLPRGALLTIESPDFAGLLHSWSTSPECAAWLRSANYSVFSNSRLFGRLSDAQDQFASTAKLGDAGTSLLQQVAGGESIFAWYDVGQLQFLYITRMPSAQAQASALFAQRASFQRRQVGSTPFWVRTETPAGSTSSRTVAFATFGDLLLLSTREDLMASALQLIGAPGKGSLAAEPWYTAVSSAQPGESAAPALHMVLDLERIVPMPYFRSYWIQGNVSEMKGYRSAVADLYRERTSAGARFREERTLIPANTSSPFAATADLQPLANLVPSGTGVFRAHATADPQAAIALLNEKLLTHATDTSTPATTAPDPELAPTLLGSSVDLETRIDIPAPITAAASGEALRKLLGDSGLEGTLSLDLLGEVAGQGVWLPLHSAVVFQTAHALPAAALGSALEELLRGTLTASDLGIELHPDAADASVLELSGPKPLFLSQRGGLTLFSDDLPTLRAMLTRVGAPASGTGGQLLLAGFDHTATRKPYARLTGLIDGSGTGSVQSDAGDGATAPGQAPAFFSSNIASLSSAFARMASEQVSVRQAGSNVHQTIIYQWQP